MNREAEERQSKRWYKRPNRRPRLTSRYGGTSSHVSVLHINFRVICRRAEGSGPSVEELDNKCLKTREILVIHFAAPQDYRRPEIKTNRYYSCCVSPSLTHKPNLPQGKHEKAEPLLEHAMEVLEDTLGSDDLMVGVTLILKAEILMLQV